MSNIGLFGTVPDPARAKEDIVGVLSVALGEEQESPGLYEIREDLFRKAEDRLNKTMRRLKR